MNNNSGEDYPQIEVEYLLDDGNPVRFEPILNANQKLILRPVYSFQTDRYAAAPLEEGREFEFVETMPRRKVRALKNDNPK